MEESTNLASIPTVIKVAGELLGILHAEGRRLFKYAVIVEHTEKEVIEAMLKLYEKGLPEGVSFYGEDEGRRIFDVLNSAGESTPFCIFYLVIL